MREKNIEAWNQRPVDNIKYINIHVTWVMVEEDRGTKEYLKIQWPKASQIWWKTVIYISNKFNELQRR